MTIIIYFLLNFAIFAFYLYSNNFLLEADYNSFYYIHAHYYNAYHSINTKLYLFITVISSSVNYLFYIFTIFCDINANTCILAIIII